MMTALLAAEAGGPTITAEGFFLENVFIIPLIMAVSFAVILFFGKRMPKGGSEFGIAAVGLCLLLSIITAGQWIGQVNKADGCTIMTPGISSSDCRSRFSMADLIRKYGWMIRIMRRCRPESPAPGSVGRVNSVLMCTSLASCRRRQPIRFSVRCSALRNVGFPRPSLVYIRCNW